MVNKFNKRAKSVIAIYGIILLLYILTFIIIPFPKSATSWISFGFTVLSITVSLIACGYAFYTKSTVNAIYGFPIFKIGLIYMVAQSAVGIAFCIASAFIIIRYWIPLILSVLMFGITVILLIATGNVRDTVEDIENSDAEKIKVLSSFNVDISGIVDLCEDNELKPLLQELNDTFKYSSDPISSEATQVIEAQLEKELVELKELVSTSETDTAIKKTKSIGNLLAERNRICQSNKR